MSSPIHRRRSHSSSSPFSGIRSLDDAKRRSATKRARPSTPRSPSGKGIFPGEPLEKWDVDQWRRGKRARRDAVSPKGMMDERRSPVLGSVFQEKRAAPLSRPMLSGFACTPDAFDLFPNRKSPRRASQTSPRLSDPLPSSRTVPLDELTRLRSDAFWELHRSVAENGEGLVRRMRDWEDNRSGSEARSERAHVKDQGRRKRRSARHSFTLSEDSPIIPAIEDEDDVEIVFGDASSGLAYSRNRSPAHKKRAASLGMMDVDMPDVEAYSPSYMSAEDGERCSSPLEVSSGFSTFSSDDEQSPMDGMHDLGASRTPALSHTYTNSTNSSVVSLPLSSAPVAAHSTDLAIQGHNSPFSFAHSSGPSTSSAQVSLSSTRSEKAIAALTLAMANGAAGLNDYAPLHAEQGATALDECQVGEMWH
ncbi:hypothetical protein CERSUDRAFT_110336 [Gelatoporia subvermispora B]|uniref:Uncharacterized protein n=1 Tax=Ceriporiopsis subvermispora (strain B) TaxID=914234 RepID=M2RTI7_CERS8|nr:hypothetical protein CERSUDRAFT_110336 [Gelatoporia subvermispora B]